MALAFHGTVPGAAGQKRLGCVGSLPVRGCGRAVECRPLVLVFLAAAPGSCCLLVVDGEARVRCGCPPEGVDAGGKCPLGSGF